MKQDGQSVRDISGDNKSLIIMTDNFNSYVFPDGIGEGNCMENRFIDRRFTRHPFCLRTVLMAYDVTLRVIC